MDGFFDVIGDREFSSTGVDLEADTPYARVEHKLEAYRWRDSPSSLGIIMDKNNDSDRKDKAILVGLASVYYDSSKYKASKRIGKSHGIDYTIIIPVVIGDVKDLQ